MKYSFKDLVDISKLQELTDELYTVATIPSSIIAMDGEILTGSGWQKICTDFHRQHPQTEKECIESDTKIRVKIDKGETFAIYKCPRGLVDASSPVVIDGEHVANVFSGQVLLEPADDKLEQFFREQARKFGFDEAAYIKAFREIPVLTKEKFRAGVSLLSKLSHLVADMGLTRLKELKVMEELRDSNETTRALLNATTESVLLLDLNGTVITGNKVTTQRLGVSIDDLIGQNIYDFLPSQVAESRRGKAQKVALTGEPVRFEDEGQGIVVDQTIYPIFDSHDKVYRFAVYSNDITERKQTEEALRKSEIHYRSLFDNSLDAFLFTAPDGSILDANPAACKMFGRTAEEIKKLGRNGLVDVTDPRLQKSLEERALTGKGRAEITMIRADQTKFPADISSMIFTDQNGLEKTSMIIRDITERKLAEQRIEHLNRVLKSIREVDQLIVRERDTDALIHECCRVLVENRGYESALLVLTDESNRPLAWAAAGVAASYQSLKTMFERYQLPPCVNTQPHEKVVLIDDRPGICDKCPIAEGCTAMRSLYVQLIHDGRVFGHLVAALLNHDLSVDDEEKSLFAEMAADLTHALYSLKMESAHKESEHKRQELEAQLLQAQKMEAVGRLAGGVAHDYNNMLGIIIGYTEMAVNKMKRTDPLHADLMEVLTAAKRSADITRQLLAFARQQTVAPKVLYLNETVEAMLKMLRRLIGEDIDLAWLPGKKVWPVKIDPAQIDQILANLCINARDAIAGVGKVTIETNNISLNKDFCEARGGYAPGDYVMLTVSDDGYGMAPETLHKIFEPFFTTKGVGKGTGLGLATVYGIVKQNNGFINVDSEPEKGSTFKIYLPRHGS